MKHLGCTSCNSCKPVSQALPLVNSNLEMTVQRAQESVEGRLLSPSMLQHHTPCTWARTWPSVLHCIPPVVFSPECPSLQPMHTCMGTYKLSLNYCINTHNVILKPWYKGKWFVFIDKHNYSVSIYIMYTKGQRMVPHPTHVC